MSEAPVTPRKKSAGRLALIGLALILLGIGAAASVGVLFARQDPTGEAMMGGLLFFAGAGSGLLFLIAAAIVALRNRAASRH
jgi:hypothetical protein